MTSVTSSLQGQNSGPGMHSMGQQGPGSKGEATPTPHTWGVEGQTLTPD